MNKAMKITQEIIENDDDVPEEIEHDLIKDSVLEIANTNFQISDDFDELPAGQIRRNVGEELSAEYEGKPVSRKSFTQKNWMNDRVSDESDVELGDDSLMDSDEFSDKDDGDLEDDGSSDDSEEEKEEGSENSDEDSEAASGEDTRKSKEADEMDINIFSSRIKNVDEDIKKGNAIKNQLLLWENLIECRIKLQKGLAASNRLMQKDTFAEFKSQLSSDELSNVNSAYKGLVDLLENFIQLRESLLKKCPEYVNFKKGGLKEIKKNTGDDDEEITSESENENEKEDKESEEEGNIDNEESSPPKKRKTIKDYSDYLGNSNKTYMPFRDAIIQKWNDKTRLASGKIGISKFAILEQSTLKQIEQILLDRDRLLKRTQTKRSKLPILGKKKQDEDIPKNEDIDEELPQQYPSKEEDLDVEIFDDDDFYHKLLKDFIDRKTSDVTDPTQLGRQWTKLQKLRSKMKKKVDTRATKGRKLRYTVHNKLVNFMAPIPYNTWDNKVEQDLFRSLFGQASVTSTLPSQ